MFKLFIKEGKYSILDGVEVKVINQFYDIENGYVEVYVPLIDAFIIVKGIEIEGEDI